VDRPQQPDSAVQQFFLLFLVLLLATLAPTAARTAPAPAEGDLTISDNARVDALTVAATHELVRDAAFSTRGQFSSRPSIPPIAPQAGLGMLAFVVLSLTWTAAERSSVTSARPSTQRPPRARQQSRWAWES
jgi:hypothetical protein